MYFFFLLPRLNCTFAGMKRAIVIGATSGIGRQVAQLLIQNGWHVGMAARRIETLNELKQIAPERSYIRQIDVTQPGASDLLLELFNELGGANLFFYAAGIGWQNKGLEESKELQTIETNALGFARMVGTAFRYFAEHAGGHIAIVSSIAGTKGLGPAPAYSATKALQNTYIQALEQLSHARNLHIQFTDIRPGFVNTPLLYPDTPDTPESQASSNKGYPMQMSSRYVAKHIVKAIYRKKRVIVIDWRWRLVNFLWRLLPNRIWRHIRL